MIFFGVNCLPCDFYFTGLVSFKLCKNPCDGAIFLNESCNNLSDESCAFRDIFGICELCHESFYLYNGMCLNNIYINTDRLTDHKNDNYFSWAIEHIAACPSNCLQCEYDSDENNLKCINPENK